MSLLAVFIQQYITQPQRRRLNHPNGSSLRCVGIVRAPIYSEFFVSESGPRGWKSFVRGFQFLVGRDSSVGIVTAYRLDGPGIESR